MLALKGLGWISLCVHVCVYVHFVCAHANAVHNLSAGRGSTRLHEDESVSWSAKTEIPPSLHTQFISIHANCFICNCA